MSISINNKDANSACANSCDKQKRNVRVKDVSVSTKEENPITVMDKHIARIIAPSFTNENTILDPSFFTTENDHYEIQSYAFKDRIGRDCHIVAPKGKEYKNFHDFHKTASKEDKLELFQMIGKLGEKARGFKFVIDTDPSAKKMRMFLASGKDVPIPDVRWESNKKMHKGKAGSRNNNPLFEKAQSGLQTTLDCFSDHFVRFKTPKPNHDLVCPKQKDGYEDIMQFIKNASDEQKLELLDMLAKNAEPDNKIYVNSGQSRRIPWMHIHMLYGDAHKKRQF